MHPVTYLEISDSAIYWLVSAGGRDDNRTLPDGYRVIEGIVEVPVPGRVARGLAARGFACVQADTGGIGRPMVGPSGEAVMSPMAAQETPSPPAPRRRGRPFTSIGDLDG